MLALLMPLPAHGFAIDPGSSARLAELGVTRVSLLQDPESVAVILEGWAFDAEHSGAAAREALVGTTGEARLLRGAARVQLTAASRHNRATGGQ